MLESTSSLLRAAPIRGLLATRPLRITTRWSSATSLLLLCTVRRAVPRCAGDGTSVDEVPATVAAVALPEVAVDQSRTNFIAAVTTSAIDAKNKLVGFQGDFTFDERVVTFQSEPVQKAGTHRRQLERVGERSAWNGTDQDAARIGLLERLHAAVRIGNAVRTEDDPG